MHVDSCIPQITDCRVFVSCAATSVCVVRGWKDFAVSGSSFRTAAVSFSPPVHTIQEISESFRLFVDAWILGAMPVFQVSGSF